MLCGHDYRSYLLLGFYGLNRRGVAPITKAKDSNHRAENRRTKTERMTPLVTSVKTPAPCSSDPSECLGSVDSGSFGLGASARPGLAYDILRSIKSLADQGGLTLLSASDPTRFLFFLVSGLAPGGHSMLGREPEHIVPDMHNITDFCIVPHYDEYSLGIVSGGNDGVLTYIAIRTGLYVNLNSHLDTQGI
jgi:hypothetical protein